MKATFSNIGIIYRFFSSKRAPSKQTMASLRFFPNLVPDLTADGPATVDIPAESITSTINNIVNKIKSNLKPELSNATDGLYLGTAGVAYMYYHLSRVPTLSEFRIEYLKDAMNYLNPALSVAQKNERLRSDLPAFLLGNCGIYAVAAAILKAAGEATESQKYMQNFYDIANICKEMQFLDCGSDELFVGRAGTTLFKEKINAI